MGYANKVQLTLVGRFEIILKGQTVPYTLKRSSKAKLIWLHIKRDIGLTVTIPYRYNTRNLREFLEAKSAWIIKNLAKLRSSAPNKAQEGQTSLDSICYLGKPLLPLFPEIVNESQLRREFSCGNLIEWLKNEAVRLINLKVDQFGRRMGLIYNSVRIRDQKSRWGSCSCKRNLSFNWRLIMAPEAALDYVVIHEICHLREMSHSKSFWSLVAEYCPGWREQRKWLNDHCSELNLVH